MPEYVVTFGQQYPREEHPSNREGGPVLAHHDGYWTIVADDEDRARELAFALIGPQWGFISDRRTTDDPEHWYPLGELLRVVDTGRMDGRTTDQFVGEYLDAEGRPDGQVLVTLWGAEGEVARRPAEGATWGMPSRVARR